MIGKRIGVSSRAPCVFAGGLLDQLNVLEDVKHRFKSAFETLLFSHLSLV